MKSPITGKEMSIQKEWTSLSFRKEDFKILYHTYKCEDTGEEFENDELANLNYNQVVNQYRAKYSIPFPEQIIAIREKYNLPATKMSEILGFGINGYRQYENGEVPNLSNARLIQLVDDPHEFRKLAEQCPTLDGKTKSKLLNRIQGLIDEQKENKFDRQLENYLLGTNIPSTFTGYRKPNFDKLTEMIIFFAEKMQPYKTKLNKLLFYSDFEMFGHSGYSISGAQYVAIPMGPVPDNFNSIFEYLVKENILTVEYYTFPDGGIGEKYTALRKPNPALFSEEEKEMLSRVNQKFDTTKTQEIIRLSHQEKAWIENSENTNQPIDYFYAFDLIHI